ncbi:MAG: DUF6575 domain-containing protein [Saprospiraceae bacterium]
MNIPLSVQETLIWHDVPQLFVASDPVGGLYLCLLTDDSSETPAYVAVAVSAERLRAVRQGQTDLHSAFARPELGCWLSISDFFEKNALAELLPEQKTLPENWLPTPGEYLSQVPGEASALAPESFEAVKVSAVAKEAGMNPALLRQYIAGVKRPSPEQSRRVQEALHRVARRLLELRFV